MAQGLLWCIAHYRGNFMSILQGIIVFFVIIAPSLLVFAIALMRAQQVNKFQRTCRPATPRFDYHAANDGHGAQLAGRHAEA